MTAVGRAGGVQSRNPRPRQVQCAWDPKQVAIAPEGQSPGVGGQEAFAIAPARPAPGYREQMSQRLDVN